MRVRWLLLAASFAVVGCHEQTVTVAQLPPPTLRMRHYPIDPERPRPVIDASLDFDGSADSCPTVGKDFAAALDGKPANGVQRGQRVGASIGKGGGAHCIYPGAYFEGPDSVSTSHVKLWDGTAAIEAEVVGLTETRRIEVSGELVPGHEATLRWFPEGDHFDGEVKITFSYDLPVGTSGRSFWTVRNDAITREGNAYRFTVPMNAHEGKGLLYLNEEGDYPSVKMKVTSCTGAAKCEAELRFWHNEPSVAAKVVSGAER